MIKSNYRLGKYEKHECWVFFKNRMRPFSHFMLLALSFQTRLKRYPFSRHWGGRPSEPALQQEISMFANYSSHHSPIKTPHFFLAAASLSLPRIPFAKQKLTCACNRMNNAKNNAIVCIAFRKRSLFASRCFKITEYILPANNDIESLTKSSHWSPLVQVTSSWRFGDIYILVTGKLSAGLIRPEQSTLEFILSHHVSS